VFDYADIALYAAEFLLAHYPDRLLQRYGLSELAETDIEMLDMIARKRGCTRKGGGVDIQKVSSLLITEIRAGLLGPITWETPEMTAREVEQAAIDDEKRRLEKEESDRIRRLKTKKNRR
jgi:ribosome biogenesis GTPase A